MTVLVVSLAAAIFAPREEADGLVASSVSRNPVRTVAERPLRSGSGQAPLRVSSTDGVKFPARTGSWSEGAAPVDLFAAKTWVVAPPPAPLRVVKPEPPPKPVAPALPFTFMGRLADGDEPVIYLVGGGRTHSVKGGEVLDGRYRVDRVTPSAVEFTYLPLEEKQVLTLPAAR
jgi:hypothetical protein